MNIPPSDPTEIADAAWAACNIFRGGMDPGEFRNYILVFWTWKFLSDGWEDQRQESPAGSSHGGGTLVQRFFRDRFEMPSGCDFGSVRAGRREPDLGSRIDHAVRCIEGANPSSLANVLTFAEFDSESKLGNLQQRDSLLNALINLFSDPRLDLRPSHAVSAEIIGDAFESLIGRFALSGGKGSGDAYTSRQVSLLLTRLLRPQAGQSIYDPVCGSGSLLIQMALQRGNGSEGIFGQELNGSTWVICRMNLLMHGLDEAHIALGDSIRQPGFIAHGRLEQFDLVTAQPPFASVDWGHETARHDPFQRFYRGVPPQKRGDWAFISHMVESAVEKQGKVGVVSPHGVLSRGAAEGLIRRRMVEEQLLEAVIGLPAMLSAGMNIPTVLLIFNKAGTHGGDVLFMDASKEYEPGKGLNRLRAKDGDRIAAAYGRFADEQGFARRVTLQEMEDENWDLSIPRYVSPLQEGVVIDLAAVKQEIRDLEGELDAVHRETAVYLEELGLT